MRNILAVALVAVALGGTPASASPSDIRVFESRSHSQVTEGETTLAAEPDAVYAAATDFQRWTVMFPSIRQAIVTRQTASDAWVTFVHADGHRDNLHFRNRPAERTVWFEDTGGRAEVWAELVFVPGELPGTTRVHSRLYADVHGIASLVVSNRRLRDMRTQHVRDDLSHLRRYFDRSLTASER